MARGKARQRTAKQGKGCQQTESTIMWVIKGKARQGKAREGKG